MKYFQVWWCEACGVRSKVRVTEGAGAWEVINKIEDDHKRKSPECPAPTESLRAEADDRGGNW